MDVAVHMYVLQTYLESASPHRQKLLCVFEKLWLRRRRQTTAARLSSKQRVPSLYLPLLSTSKRPASARRGEKRQWCARLRAVDLENGFYPLESARASLFAGVLRRRRLLSRRAQRSAIGGTKTQDERKRKKERMEGRSTKHFEKKVAARHGVLSSRPRGAQGEREKEREREI